MKDVDCNCERWSHPYHSKRRLPKSDDWGRWVDCVGELSRAEEGGSG